MTETEQIIAIAKVCKWTPMDWNNAVRYGPATHGFRPATFGGRKARIMYPPGVPAGGRGEVIPDYLNDLNAMHEAEEKVFGDSQQKWDQFTRILVNHGHPDCLHSRIEIIRATAAQRAEAFLKTLGLWKEAA